MNFFLGALIADLCAAVDSGDVLVEASILGEKGYFDCPVKLTLYGTADPIARASLEERLKSDRLLRATQLKQTRPKPPEPPRKNVMGLKSSQSRAGLPAEPEISLDQLAQLSQAVQFRSGDDNLKMLAMDEDALSKLPQAEQPQEIRSTLLPYQLQGLEWLRSRENPQFPPQGSSQATQLWKRDSRGRFTNIAATFTTARTPALAKGGILADDMGLGKTLQMLSLILSGGKGAEATLIVAPVSVMVSASRFTFLPRRLNTLRFVLGAVSTALRNGHLRSSQRCYLERDTGGTIIYGIPMGNLRWGNRLLAPVG